MNSCEKCGSKRIIEKTYFTFCIRCDLIFYKDELYEESVIIKTIKNLEKEIFKLNKKVKKYKKVKNTIAGKQLPFNEHFFVSYADLTLKGDMIELLEKLRLLIILEEEIKKEIEELEKELEGSATKVLEPEFLIKKVKSILENALVSIDNRDIEVIKEIEIDYIYSLIECVFFKSFLGSDIIDYLNEIARYINIFKQINKGEGAFIYFNIIEDYIKQVLKYIEELNNFMKEEKNC